MSWSKNTSKLPTSPHPEHLLKGALQQRQGVDKETLSLIASSLLGSLSSPCLFFLAFSERELFLCRSFFSLSSPRLVQTRLNHGIEWVGMCFFSPKDTQTYIHTCAHKLTLWRIPGGLEDAACGSAFWHFSSLISSFPLHFLVFMCWCIMDFCILPDVWHNEPVLANLLIPLKLLQMLFLPPLCDFSSTADLCKNNITPHMVSSVQPLYVVMKNLDSD